MVKSYYWAHTEHEFNKPEPFCELDMWKASYVLKEESFGATMLEKDNKEQEKAKHKLKGSGFEKSRLLKGSSIGEPRSCCLIFTKSNFLYLL